jgi:hypothetical protein
VRACIEVIPVAVCDDDGIKSAHDLFGREGQWDGRITDRVARMLDRRSRTGVVEHRIYEDPLSVELEDDRGVAD